MVNTLDNQTVVVLGGSAGLGYGVAKHILETTKANVVIGSSSANRLDKAVSTLSPFGAGRVVGHTVNLDVSTSETQIAEFFDKVGTFNHLVYTAADGLSMVPLSEISKATGEKVFGLRYWSLLTAIRLALPHMPKSNETSITVTSGTILFRPIKGAGVGSGVAGAIEVLARGLAVDLAPIRVNCIVPGLIADTDLWKDWDPEVFNGMTTKLEEKLLTGRVGRADEVAEAYGYVLRGTHTTGQTLVIDGGESLT
jgi:NAD(P)-dependent dehydrogenase (short-subunit alcohol dehydrogenase family)